MRLHRMCAQANSISDFVVAHASHHMVQHLPFTAREAFKDMPTPSRGFAVTDQIIHVTAREPATSLADLIQRLGNKRVAILLVDNPLDYRPVKQEKNIIVSICINQNYPTQRHVLLDTTKQPFDFRGGKVQHIDENQVILNLITEKIFTADCCAGYATLVFN